MALPAPRSSCSPWLSSFGLMFGIAFVALLARLLYVQFFTAPMPYWDQWDGEGASALRPWLDGTLQWHMLLAPHNEHRILPTRLVTLATYCLTGQWNNLYEARVGAVVFCFIPAVLIWHALRDGSSAAGRWLLVSLAVLVSILPFAWENFLVGFQSQFYFLILSSVVAIGLAGRAHQNIPALIIAMALSLLASVTMASGLLTAVAVGTTCVMACICLPGRRMPALITTLLLAALAIAAYVSIPVIEVNAVFKARSFGEFAYAASRTLAWPMRSGGFALILWLPGAVMIGRMLVRRRATPAELVMAGLCIWSALQALAIAYGRGHGMKVPMSRYTELFVPGVFANAWFAIQLWGLLPAPSRLRTVARTAVVLFALLLVYSLLGRVGKDVAKIQQFAVATRIQQENVLRYLASGDPAALDVGEFELPYPDAARLKSLLDDPLLRQTLPVQDAAELSPVRGNVVP